VDILSQLPANSPESSSADLELRRRRRPQGPIIEAEQVTQQCHVNPSMGQQLLYSVFEGVQGMVEGGLQNVASRLYEQRT